MNPQTTAIDTMLNNPALGFVLKVGCQNRMQNLWILNTFEEALYQVKTMYSRGSGYEVSISKVTVYPMSNYIEARGFIRYTAENQDKYITFTITSANKAS